MRVEIPGLRGRMREVVNQPAVTETQVRAGSPSGISWEPAAADTPEGTRRMSAVHYSSAFSAWRTPRGIFADLHREFDFTVDGCASDENALLPRYWTESDEPLLLSWQGERVFINPPYGRQLGRWMEKAWTESQHALVVALIPSRTDTAWWHDYVMRAGELRFVRKRIRFGAVTPTGTSLAPFPSAIAVWGVGGAD